MPRNKLHLLDQSLEETNRWLKEIEFEMPGSDRQEAYHALRGVLFALRDRTTPEEAHHLASQLPMLMRGIYFEGYKPANKPVKIRDRQSFLDYIVDELATTGIEGRVFDAFHAVITVLDRHISGTELRQIWAMMPEEIRTLWPEVLQETTTSIRPGASTEANRPA